MNLLLHCCCGPCSTATVGYLRSLDDEVTGWFFNPNIHPAEEWERRREAFEQAAGALELPVLHGGPAMGYREFLLAIASRGGTRRCLACWELRLTETAREAAARGFDGFSTTLVISPYQDVNAIGEIGRAMAAHFGVGFRFADLRDRYPESVVQARELGLYRQNYCGCLLSRLERSEQRSRRAVQKLRLTAAG